MSPTFNSMYPDDTSTGNFLKIYNANFRVPPFGDSNITENELYKEYLFGVDNYSLKLGDLVPLLTWQLIMSAEPVKPRETAGHKGGKKKQKTQNIKNTKKGRRNKKHNNKSKNKRI